MRSPALPGLATTVLAVLGLAASFGVLVTPAYADEVLPVTSVSPADGATIPLPTQGIPFEIQSPIAFNSTECLGGAYIAVSSQDLLNQISPQEGPPRLANDFQVDYREMTPSQAYPGVLWAVSGYVSGGRWWSSTPGTYYWQVEGRCFLTFNYYLSPIYRLTIAPPTPPPPTAQPVTAPQEPPPEALTLTKAYEEVPYTIRRKTGHKARHLHDHCEDDNAIEATCNASWMAPLPVSARTWQYSGTFQVQTDGERIISHFRGIKAQYVCVQHHSLKACKRHVHW